MICDLHNHLLPNVDDGSRSMEETLRHLGAFRTQGVTSVVFTPHLLASQLDRSGIEATLELHRRRFEQVLEALDEARAAGGSFPEVILGQEILAPTPEALDPVVDRQDVGFAGGRALLVEFGFSPGFRAEEVIRRVLDSGRTIVVAHPERYLYGNLDPMAAAARWREEGALLQLNGGSLSGLYTEGAADLAARFLEADLIDLIASDHHGDQRNHGPGLIREVHTFRVGAPRVRALMEQAPASVLAA